jgi:hypothetical protein
VHAQLFSESSIAIPQLEGSISAIVIPHLFKELLLRNRNSAIPQSQFFLKSATSKLHFRNFGIFLAVQSGRYMKKKLEVKYLVQLSL